MLIWSSSSPREGGEWLERWCVEGEERSQHCADMQTLSICIHNNHRVRRIKIHVGSNHRCVVDKFVIPPKVKKTRLGQTVEEMVEDGVERTQNTETSRRKSKAQSPK